MHHLLSSKHKHTVSQSNQGGVPSVSRHYFFIKQWHFIRNPNITLILAVNLLFQGAIKLQVCGCILQTLNRRTVLIHLSFSSASSTASTEEKKHIWKTSQMQQLPKCIYICSLLVNTSTALPLWLILFASLTAAVLITNMRFILIKGIFLVQYKVRSNDSMLITINRLT